MHVLRPSLREIKIQRKFIAREILLQAVSKMVEQCVDDEFQERIDMIRHDHCFL